MTFGIVQRSFQGGNSFRVKFDNGETYRLRDKDFIFVTNNPSHHPIGRNLGEEIETEEVDATTEKR